MQKLVRLVALVAIAIGSAAVPAQAGVQLDGGTCGAGGPGSTGCSIEALGFSCSVTCAEGYHACCNATGLGGGTAGCRCVQILAQ